MAKKKPVKFEVDIEKLPDVIVPDINILNENPSFYQHVQKPGGPHTQAMHKRSKWKWYTEDERIKVCSVYVMTGNAAETSRITGVPHDRIRHWKLEPWWNEVVSRIKFDNDDELDAKFTKVVNKAVDQVTERIEKGDYVYDSRNQQVIRKPMSGRDLAVTTAMFVDKRTLLRGKKKVGEESATVNDRLKRLAEEFEKFTKAREIKGEVIKDERQIEGSVEGQDPLPQERVLSPEGLLTEVVVDQGLAVSA